MLEPAGKEAEKSFNMISEAASQFWFLTDVCAGWWLGVPTRALVSSIQLKYVGCGHLSVVDFGDGWVFGDDGHDGGVKGKTDLKNMMSTIKKLDIGRIIHSVSP